MESWVYVAWPVLDAIHLDVLVVALVALSSRLMAFVAVVQLDVDTQIL